MIFAHLLDQLPNTWESISFLLQVKITPYDIIAQHGRKGLNYLLFVQSKSKVKYFWQNFSAPFRDYFLFKKNFGGHLSFNWDIK